MVNVLLVTFTLMPDGEPGGAGLTAALTERGIDSRWVSWDDPDVDWSGALDAYYDEHDEILTGGPARSPALVRIDETDAAASALWRVEQTIDDPDGNHDWRTRAEVDLAASEDAGTAVVRITEVVRL